MTNNYISLKKNVFLNKRSTGTFYDNPQPKLFVKLVAVGQ